jgi:hypothetical protein
MEDRVTLVTVENRKTLTREVPYGFAIKFLGTGFQRVIITDKQGIILHTEGN